MEVICLSAKNPRSQEIYKGITVGKKYVMIEKVVGSQIRIWNDSNDPINYPSQCFNIPKQTSKGVKVCNKCQTKFIGKEATCRKCTACSSKYLAPERKVLKRKYILNSALYRKFRKFNLKTNCQHCGKKTGLELHHIKPVSEYPFMALIASNVLTLCRDCHTAQHRAL